MSSFEASVGEEGEAARPDVRRGVELMQKCRFVGRADKSTGKAMVIRTRSGDVVGVLLQKARFGTAVCDLELQWASISRTVESNDLFVMRSIHLGAETCHFIL